MYDYDWLCQISSVYHGVPVDFLAMAPWTYQVVMIFFSQVRLRGIGSGFLEGSDGTEAWIMGIWGCLPPMPAPSPDAIVKRPATCSYQANMPLQLNVSCTDYTDYVCISTV